MQKQRFNFQGSRIDLETHWTIFANEKKRESHTVYLRNWESERHGLILRVFSIYELCE